MCTFNILSSRFGPKADFGRPASPNPGGKLTGKAALLAWCADVTDGYPGVAVENFSTSWGDGLAFCALVHRFFPHDINYKEMTKLGIKGMIPSPLF